MQEVLIAKLHQYITDNHPDLLITLQHGGNVSNYLKEKVAAIAPMLDELLAVNTPAYLIQNDCMAELIKDLIPSKYNYLNAVLEEEFELDYYRLKQSGTLTYEIINLIEACRPVFDSIGFTKDSENDPYLRYAITGVIKGYVEDKQ